MAPSSFTQIMYLQALGNYTLFVHSNGMKKLSSTTLGVHEARFGERIFVRIHRQFLINRSFVERIELGRKSSWVQLTNGDKMPVSRRKVNEVLRQFTELCTS